jgi:hypothetical protein
MIVTINDDDDAGKCFQTREATREETRQVAKVINNTFHASAVRDRVSHRDADDADEQHSMRAYRVQGSDEPLLGPASLRGAHDSKHNDPGRGTGGQHLVMNHLPIGT